MALTYTDLSRVEAVPSRSPLLVLQFPEGKSLLTVDWVGVLARCLCLLVGHFCINTSNRRKKKMIGRALITDDVKRDIPKPQRLGRLQGRLVKSRDVLALDSQSIMIKDLVYPGGQPETRFTIGQGSRPGPHGIALPDEDGESRSLRAYRNRTIILTLPPSIDLQSMSWLAMWSKVLDHTEDIPHNTNNVAGARQRLGLDSSARAPHRSTFPTGSRHLTSGAFDSQERF